MPCRQSRTRTSRLLVGLAAALCLASAYRPSDAAAVQNSGLDAPLFYQLLIGELELQAGQPGTAFQVMLEAARRTRDEALFRRAVEIALNARAGEDALAATRAWRKALPESLDAHRYLVQLLVMLDRDQELVEPLGSLIALPPDEERGARIASLPRLFARSKDKQEAARIVEQVLRPWLERPAEGVAAHTALARAWFAAGESARAKALVERAHRLDPQAEGPVLLALEMLATDASLESIVTAYLATPGAKMAVRLGYARALTSAQRYIDAVAQLEIATSAEPEFAPAWLSMGALYLELRQPTDAERALERYLEGASSDTSVDEEARNRGITQAHLMLAQAAEQRRDFRAAEAWLAKIDDPQRALEVQNRRASLLARQGRLQEARELLRAAPEHSEGDARAKLLAEAQLLREQKQWLEAHTVLQQAIERFSGDVDLLYEQAMVAEKLDRMDEMESLLREVIRIKPDHHHAYNALGYSLADRNVRLEEARDLIKKALSLSPGEPFITDSLGWVEFRMGNRDDALRLLREAYHARPDPEIGAHLGEVLWVSDQRDEARRVWRESRERDTNNEVLQETLKRLRVDL